MGLYLWSQSRFKAIKVDDKISLVFTKVFDEVKFELLDEDTVSEPTDRAYWEKKATKSTLNLVDHIFKKLGNVTDGYRLKYNKYYIGLERDGIANNFIEFVPRKSTVIMLFKIDRSGELDELIQNSDLDELAYDTQWRQYRVRLKETDLKSNFDTILQLAEIAKKEYNSWYPILTHP